MTSVRLLTVSAAAVALSACGPGQSTPPAPTTPPPAVANSAAQQLCDQLQGALPDWRIQTPSLTHPAFNVLVQAWGLQNGVTAQIVSHRALVDDVTTRQCAQTRSDALKALELPSLAAGLVGLG
ncbi:MAG: hypothetical protein LLG14_01660 [Nocardiaceae bacterium]|nr:hypothetical protein [Nocardiaceae bacterium]